MNIEEAKEFLIKNYDPKELALDARRATYYKYPIDWIEHREGGAVIIEDANWNFKKIKEEDIIDLAELLLLIEQSINYNKDKTLSEYLDQFSSNNES